MAITSCFKDLILVAVAPMRPQQNPCASLYIEQSRGKAQFHCHPDFPSRQLLIHFQMFPVLLLQEPQENMKRETYFSQLNMFILVEHIIILPYKV